MHRLLLLLSILAFLAPEVAVAETSAEVKAAKKRSSKKKAKKKAAKKKSIKKKKARKKRASDRRAKAGPKPKPKVRRARKKPKTRRAKRKPRRPRATRRSPRRPRAQPRRQARRRPRREARPPAPTPPASSPPEAEEAPGSSVSVWIDTRERITETVRERSAAGGAPRVTSSSDPNGGGGAYGTSSTAGFLKQPTGPDKNRPEAGELDPPTVEVQPEVAVADVTAQESAAVEDPFLRSVGIDASYANWALQPLANDRQTTARAELTTVERYDIAPIHLYRAALKVETRYATVGFAYETDRGFDAGHDPSRLFDVLVQLAGVPGLDRLTLEYRDLDFRYGEVDLVDRASDETLQHEDFSVTARTGELRFRVDAGLYLFGRYLGYALPRTLYLEEDNAAGKLYHQVSSGLLEVDADVWMLGVGWKRPPGPSPWEAGFHIGGGAGPYDINALSDGQRFDGGTLAAISAGGRIGYRWSVNEWFALGARDELTMILLDPVGLPDGIERDFDDEGVDTERFSVDLGAVELLNHLTLYAELRL